VLAPVDFLSSIVTAWPAGLGVLDALAIDDRGRRAGVSSTMVSAHLARGSPVAPGMIDDGLVEMASGLALARRGLSENRPSTSSR
jgi:hypothetical protein